jgi:hypothetical protein
MTRSLGARFLPAVLAATGMAPAQPAWQAAAYDHYNKALFDAAGLPTQPGLDDRSFRAAAQR